LVMVFENGDDWIWEKYQGINSWIAMKYWLIETKVIGLMVESKVIIKGILALFKKEEQSEAVHIRKEATLIAPTRRSRRRYGRVWKKHVDLSDGGIFSSLNSDSDSDSDSDENRTENDLWDGGLFNSQDSDSDSDSDFDYIDVYDDELSEEEEKELIGRIEHLFDDSEDEETEPQEVAGYNQVTTVHNAFCWGCGAHWEEGHVCDSSFKRDLCEILQSAEKKTIGSQTDIPSIRACPNCQQLIVHTQACKHMDCRNCGKAFCFVCLKPRLDSGWQCGSYSAKCPGGCAPIQGMDDLPDAIVITKNAFNLYD